MADPAFPMSGSFQEFPSAGPQLAAPIERRPSPLAHSQHASWPDELFRYAMWACAAFVLVILALIVYELVVNSRLSWTALFLHRIVGCYPECYLWFMGGFCAGAHLADVYPAAAGENFGLDGFV